MHMVTAAPVRRSKSIFDLQLKTWMLTRTVAIFTFDKKQSSEWDEDNHFETETKTAIICMSVSNLRCIKL